MTKRQRWPIGFAADPQTTGICVDFDGTLAPIVADPALARPLEGVRSTLLSLAKSYGVVAIISGRPVQFLLSQMGLDASSSSIPAALTIAGLYGLERFVPARGIVIEEGTRQWLNAVQEATAKAEKEARSGVSVERKGLALALHWRNSQDRDEASKWAVEFASKVQSEHQLLLQHGRMSLELRPPVGGDKGTVVEELCGGLNAACFIGDDTGDLAAFAALDHLKARGMICAVKVAVASQESPDELLRQADLVVDGPVQALELLGQLV